MWQRFCGFIQFLYKLNQRLADPPTRLPPLRSWD